MENETSIPLERAPRVSLWSLMFLLAAVTGRARRRELRRPQLIICTVALLWLIGAPALAQYVDLSRRVQEIGDRQAAGIAKRDEQIANITAAISELKKNADEIRLIREAQIAMAARAEQNSLYLQILFIPLALLVVAKILDILQARAAARAPAKNPR